MTRQKILITGASSGLGAGMARRFDCVIVNAGIGKGYPLGHGKPWANDGHHRDESRGGTGADRDRAGDVHEGGRGAPGAGVLGWPWWPLVEMMKVLPSRLTRYFA